MFIVTEYAVLKEGYNILFLCIYTYLLFARFILVCFLFCFFEPVHFLQLDYQMSQGMAKTNNMACASSKSSTQRGLPSSLLYVFTVCMNKQRALQLSIGFTEMTDI